MKHFTYKLLVTILFISLLISCGGSGNKNQSEGVEVIELDLLPMYGSIPEYGSHQKNAEQQESDRIFLMKSDDVQPSRTAACIDYIEFGWYYLNQGDTETAMRRANQAWQLDSTNPDTYVLFAAILNAYGDNASAIDMLDRAINISPNYVSLYDIYLSESMDLFRQTGDNSKVKNLINMLNKITVKEDSLKTKVNTIKNDAIEFLK